MPVIPNILAGLAQVMAIVLETYKWVVIIAVLLTWVRPDPSHPLVRFFEALTGPVLRWFRKRLPFLAFGGVDLSPLAVLLVLVFLQYAVVNSLSDLAVRLR